MIDRRSFLQTTGAGMAAALAGTGAAFATPIAQSRLVMILLRGGLDGLHALPPFADNDYHRLRPSLGLTAAQKIVDLDGYFGLHPSLAPLKRLYSDGELLLMPAAAMQHHDRSHFEAQNVLENGSGKPYGARDGWLNRAIQGIETGERKLGLALGASAPLILQGDAAIQNWDDAKEPSLDADFLYHLGQMYQVDPLFLTALEEARRRHAAKTGADAEPIAPPQNENFDLSIEVTAKQLARKDGPRIAVLEMHGWDTHFDQARRLNRLLAQLAQGILTLKQDLGARIWHRTAVVVVSEFGRTALENTSNGTDHGTGGLVIMAGGAVRGGRIVGQWPGLSDNALVEGRDLRAVNSYESIFKAVLIDHLELSRAYVEENVFPNSGGVLPHKGLLHFS